MWQHVNLQKHSYAATVLKTFAAFWFVACCLSSCTPGVPSEYLQPGEMEDILYDYHLAQGILDTDGKKHSGDSVYIKAYKLAVLKKYGISESAFDKSLQYYMRHTARLHAVYEHLAQRYENEALKQGASISDLNNFGALTAKGDTADIWSGERATVLMPAPPFNILSFAFKADSTFHAGDRFTLSFNSQFIVQEGSRDAIVVLALELSNDSIVTVNRHISSNMQQSIQIGDDKRVGVRTLRGFIMFNRGYSNTETTLKLFSLTALRLIRMHTKEEPPVPTISSGDSITSSQPANIPPPLPNGPKPPIDEQPQKVEMAQPHRILHSKANPQHPDRR